jgi:imidazolonepropionase
VTDAESTPITGIGELITNGGDDGTYAALNDAALVISGDQVAWTGPPSRAAA